MPTDLHEELRELADGVPVVAPPPDLWAQGVRRTRRRRVGAVVVAVLAVLVGGLATWAQPFTTHRLEPARVPQSRLHVPDHVYAPSPWLEGTDEAGPPGPLALLEPVQHRHTSWFHTGPGVFGVSAVDGSYRFLDLPQAALSVQPVLSPDGHKVAYAVKGDVPPGAHSHIVGFAVYDTVTGKVSTSRIKARYGLVVDATGAMTWAPDSRFLVIRYSKNLRRAGFSTSTRATSWDTATGERRPLAGAGAPSTLGSSPHGVAWFSGRLIVSVDPSTGVRSRLQLHPDPRPGDDPVFSPDGSAVVYINSFDQRYYVASVSRGGSYARTRILGPTYSQAREILGWLDDTHVLIQAHLEGHDGVPVRSLNTRTGEVTPSVRLGNWSSPSIATDLLRNPLVHGVRPPSVGDPRVPVVRAGVGLGLVALIGFGVYRKFRRAAA